MPSDTRTYIKVHDGMPDHPKIDPLSDKAFRLLIELWCWCSRNLTDGHVPLATWRKRASAAVRRELLNVGLVEETSTYVFMHDYPKHQRTKVEIEALSNARREAGKRGGKRGGKPQANAEQNTPQRTEIRGSDVGSDFDLDQYSPPPKLDSGDPGGGEVASLSKTKSKIIKALTMRGYSDEVIAPGLEMFEMRVIAGEKITSPVAFVRHFADQARAAATNGEPIRAEVDGVLSDYVDGEGWVPVEEVEAS